ncbi:YebC/PmpR family DNA-binding transcriptional regulator [Azotosporobacter soli]|uniref:YebC/PmpR family DNA-binding transcriptional regulator n=1 Tax=Azotosporobacter soli TaxID=3055040 RepID=UPI0031FE8478
MSGHSKWANIKHRKGRVDALRARITTKIGREITVAVKMGGADPAGNMRLKLVLQKAKENNVPKDNIQRAIQRGSGAGDGSNYEELTYEGYGPGGVAVMVEVLTDNRNRTAADVRHLFSKYGGNLGETGCVGWMFKKQGIFLVSADGEMDEDELMLLAIEAGADDFKTEDDEYEIICSPEAFEKVQMVLEENNLNLNMARIAMLSDTTVALAEEDGQKMIRMLDALEDHDDVQEVYSNFDFPDEE